MLKKYKISLKLVCKRVYFAGPLPEKEGQGPPGYSPVNIPFCEI